MLLVECPAATICLFLIDTNARTGVRIGEKEECKVIGAYGRDTRVSDSNGTSLLRFAGDNKLALVNTFFSVPKGCTSRAFNSTRPTDRKRIDYIITRQPHRKFVRNTTVPLQPRPDSVRPQHRVRQSPTPRQIRSLSKTASPHRSQEYWQTSNHVGHQPTQTADSTCSQSAHADRTRGHSRRKSVSFHRHTHTVRREGNARPNPTVPYIWAV